VGIQVTGLNIYPIKSAGQIALQSSQVERFGLAYDRRWMVVDPSGKFITQRELASMALIHVKMDGDRLRLSAPSMELLNLVAMPVVQSMTKVGVWGDQCDAVDMGGEATAWLSEFLGRTCRLVFMPETTRRSVDSAYSNDGDTVSFADGFPILLISEASLAELSRQMQKSVAMSRFRPNIVISGCEAFAEDDWNSIRIGGIDFDITKPCARCSMPTIDQGNAEVNREIMTTLAKFRRAPDGQIYFGQNMINRGNGEIKVGDEVIVAC